MRLLPYLQLLRLPAVVTAWADILAAHLVVTGGELRPGPLLWLLLATTCLYWAGMVLNDCFDLPVDRQERPERPLPSGRIPPRHAWLLGWTLLVAGIVAAAMAGTTSLWLAIALAAAVVAYDGGLKHTRVGPVAMGLCRYLNWLLGLSVVPLAATAFALALPILLYVTSLTILSRTEVRADNRRALGGTAAGLAATAAVVAGLLAAGALTDPLALVPLALAGLFIGRDLWRIRAAFTPTNVRLTMRHLILGIVVLDAIMVAAAGLWWGAAAVLVLLVPGRALARVIPVT